MSDNNTIQNIYFYTSNYSLLIYYILYIYTQVTEYNQFNYQITRLIAKASLLLC